MSLCAGALSFWPSGRLFTLGGRWKGKRDECGEELEQVNVGYVEVGGIE